VVAAGSSRVLVVVVMPWHSVFRYSMDLVQWLGQVGVKVLV
jgi:hypothetical protein